MARPGGPSFILEAAGQPTCACFSGSQHHIVVAGTREGSIHLWDLRESGFIHKDKYDDNQLLYIVIIFEERSDKILNVTYYAGMR